MVNRKRTTVHFGIPGSSQFQSLNVHVFTWMKCPLPNPKHDYWIRAHWFIAVDPCAASPPIASLAVASVRRVRARPIQWFKQQMVVMVPHMQGDSTQLYSTQTGKSQSFPQHEIIGYSIRFSQKTQVPVAGVAVLEKKEKKRVHTHHLTSCALCKPTASGKSCSDSPITRGFSWTTHGVSILPWMRTQSWKVKHLV